MSCNKGIYRVRKCDLNSFADGNLQRISCQSFGMSDGMHNANCNGGQQPSAWKANDGRLWFPTFMGAAVVNPSAVSTNPLQPTVILEEMVADGSNVLHGVADIENQLNINLPASIEKFEFHYSCTWFTAPEYVKFKYILEGYDREWVDAGLRRSAYYTNLPRGRNYNFHVIACNNDGVWNENGASVMFYLAPYFWETWWFYTISLILAIVSGYQGFRWRVRRLRAKAKVLERVVLERTHDLQNANEEIQRQMIIQSEQAQEIALANTILHEKNQTLEHLNNEKNEFLGIAAHDMKNPLSAIMMSVGLVLRHYDQMGRDEVIKHLGIVEMVAKRMNSIITELLDINAIELGTVNMNPISLQLAQITKTVADEYLSRAAQKGITLNYQFCNESTEVRVDSNAIRSIIENLLSNAVKYSPYGKTIFIRILRKNLVVRLEIQDEGPGLSTDDQSRLFGKFVRLSAKPTAGEHSTGLGLSIVKKLVEAMNGVIWCESELGYGATFILELSIDSQPYYYIKE